jgi:hypothetical protein
MLMEEELARVRKMQLLKSVLCQVLRILTASDQRKVSAGDWASQTAIAAPELAEVMDGALDAANIHVKVTRHNTSTICFD